MGSASLLILLGCGVGFAAVAILVGFLLSVTKDNPTKGEAYECGIQTEGTTWVQFNVGYYLFALVYLVFDVELVFLYPWATVMREMGMVAFVEIAVFMFILFLGLLYAYKKHALKWM